MIEVKNLCAEVGSFRIRDLSITIDNAGHGVILGPSGSGKSLLLETIVGLSPSRSGSIIVGGTDVTALSPEDRNIAYVPQDMALFPHLSVRSNLCFGAHARGIPAGEITRRLAQLTQLFDIAHLLERKNPLTLSHGEQQRVAIARALMISPKAILLDEPFSALDAPLRRELQLLLMRINREMKITILHVTHDREEALMLGDTIAVMLGGKLLQVGNREDIYYRPSCVEVARFLLNQNIFTGLVAEHNELENTLNIKGYGMSFCAYAYSGVREGDRVYFGIRPEEVMIIRPGKTLQEPVKANLISGRIETIFRKGRSHLLLVKVPGLSDRLEIDIPSFAYHDLNLHEGKTLQLSLKMRSIWTIPVTG